MYKTNFYNEFGDIDDAEQLTQTITGEKMTYELFQYILKQDSATRFLSQDLKNKLKSSEFTELSFNEIWLVSPPAVCMVFYCVGELITTIEVI